MSFKGMVGSFITNNALPSGLINLFEGDDNQKGFGSKMNSITQNFKRWTDPNFLKNYERRNFRRVFDRAVNTAAGIGAGIGAMHLAAGRPALQGRFNPLKIGIGLATGYATMKGVQSLQHMNKEVYNLPVTLYDVLMQKRKFSGFDKGS